MVTSYDFVREIVLKDAGIVLDTGKEYLVDARLTPLVRSAGAESLEALVKSLTSGRAPHLRREIVDAMTTNETTFFRDVGPFELLRNERAARD